MKTTLLIAIVLMIIVIGCDVENNANSKDLNYLNSLILVPFLLLAIYAVTHLEEFKKAIKW